MSEKREDKDEQQSKSEAKPTPPRTHRVAVGYPHARLIVGAIEVTREFVELAEDEFRKVRAAAARHRIPLRRER